MLCYCLQSVGKTNMLSWLWGNKAVVCETADWLCRDTNGAQSIRDYIPDMIEGTVMPIMNVVANYPAVRDIGTAALVGSALIGSAWVANKLRAPDNEYKEGYKQGYALAIQNTLDPSKLHPVKEFGLILNIYAKSIEGIPSEGTNMTQGHDFITNYITSYIADLDPSVTVKSYFEQIQDAFEFTKETITYMNINKAEELFLRRFKEKKITTIPIFCKKHAMGLSLVPDQNDGAYLVFTNKGLGAKNKDRGTRIFRIPDLNKVDVHFIHKMMWGGFNETPFNNIIAAILNVVDHQHPIQYLKHSFQKIGNCTIVNPLCNIEGILLCQEGINRGIPVEEFPSDDLNIVQQYYKQFSHHLRESTIKKLAAMIKHNPLDPTLQILAKSYISQHPKPKHKKYVKILDNALKNQERGKKRPPEFGDHHEEGRPLKRFRK